jgi:hypothetical protein
MEYMITVVRLAFLIDLREKKSRFQLAQAQVDNGEHCEQNLGISRWVKPSRNWDDFPRPVMHLSLSITLVSSGPEDRNLFISC